MKVKAIIFLSALIILILVIDNLEKIDSKNSEIAFKERMSNKTRIYSLMGMKKVGADLLLLKQTANIGETFEGNRSHDIKKSSMEISELNPYFLQNYYASANVLSFIKIYLDYDGALEILDRGLLYNPNDEFLKKYMAGMVAGSKGNNEEVLSNYEEIIRTYPDPLMIKVVYNIYYKKVKMDKKYMDKYLYYAEILYKEKNGKYKQLVEDDLKELGLK